jgi:hypothetical protein
MYSETYRNCSFEITDKGFAIFTCFLPGAALRWGYWARFFTKEESIIVTNTTANREDVIKAMRNAIDRALNDNPVFRGDMRDM